MWMVMALSAALLSQPAERPCDAEAASYAGGWVEGADAGVGFGWHPLTKQHQRQIRSVLDGFAAVMKAAYPAPVGSQGKHYRNYTVESIVGSPRDATYGVTVNFKGYGCNQSGVVAQYGETATWAYVQANGVALGNIAFETRQHFLSAGDDLGIYTIPPARVLRTPSPQDGHRKPIDASLPASITALPHFTYEGEYDSTPVSYNTRTVSHVIFVTPDGGVPYDPVSIGEFLDVNETLLRVLVAEDSTLDFYQRLLARVAVLRQRYAARLGEPAYIARRHWGERALDEDEPFVAAGNGYLLCRPSSRYASAANNYLPRFLVVAWQWQPEVPYSARVHNALKAGLDVAALKAALRAP